VAARGTLIGPGTRIKGELSGDDSVDLAGTFEGSSRIAGLYHVREGARVKGDIAASDVVIEGEVEGRVVKARKVEIGASSRVRAHVRARVVAVAEGAYFEGQIHMDARRGGTARLSFQEKRKDAGRGSAGPGGESQG
jgi:cytoskeletal protein CcmA (bactofilin family)